ncbi:hypothetical protein DFJ74DRAFT_430380 [Hyaloraphidium curvatum]|nr:hypothetical protein DFJ74DRAFT_430380 [Hyaloraphidium curvatum]
MPQRRLGILPGIPAPAPPGLRRLRPRAVPPAAARHAHLLRHPRHAREPPPAPLPREARRGARNFRLQAVVVRQAQVLVGLLPAACRACGLAHALCRQGSSNLLLRMLPRVCRGMRPRVAAPLREGAVQARRQLRKPAPRLLHLVRQARRSSAARRRAPGVVRGLGAEQQEVGATGGGFSWRGLTIFRRILKVPDCVPAKMPGAKETFFDDPENERLYYEENMDVCAYCNGFHRSHDDDLEPLFCTRECAVSYAIVENVRLLTCTRGCGQMISRVHGSIMHCGGPKCRQRLTAGTYLDNVRSWPQLAPLYPELNFDDISFEGDEE